MSDFRFPANQTCRARGCGATIRWVTLNGKPHPIDPEPSKAGTLGIVETETVDPGSYENQSAHVVALSKVRRETWEGNLYVSHFATCPRAASFRGKK